MRSRDATAAAVVVDYHEIAAMELLLTFGTLTVEPPLVARRLYVCTPAPGLSVNVIVPHATPAASDLMMGRDPTITSTPPGFRISEKLM